MRSGEGLQAGEGRALAERLRQVRLGLDAVLVQLDEHECDTAGREHFEPMHLGRWFLRGVQRLVASGRVSVEDVVGAVREAVVEEAPELTRAVRLEETLRGLRDAEALGDLLERIEHEMVRSHLARNAFLDPYPNRRDEALRGRRVAEQREVLLAAALDAETSGGR